MPMQLPNKYCDMQQRNLVCSATNIMAQEASYGMKACRHAKQVLQPLCVCAEVEPLPASDIGVDLPLL